VTTTTPTRPAPAVTTERTTRKRAADQAWIIKVGLVANAILVVALWLRHGGLEATRGPGGPATALGQITALTGTYAVLVELLLMSRIPWLERYAGLDRIAVWHRWTGFAAVNLLVAHLVFTTAGYAAASHKSLAWQTFDFIRHYPDVLMAFVALALLIAVAATSVRVARARLPRETWYSVHLYAYLAVALGFAHQLAVGSDFSTDRAARIYWVALYVAVVGSIAIWRVGQPVVFNARHRLRVRAVQREAPDVVSIYLSGQRLHEVGAQPGQFFLWRFITRDGWYKAHPYSLSAPPTKRSLRITIKSLGDESEKLQRVRPGTRVFAEGPFGVFTPHLRTRRKVLLIAGGIGVTPLRAIVESLPGGAGDVVMLYRVATPDNAVFKDELQELARIRGIALYILPGTEIGDDDTDLLGVPALRKGVPDIRSRDCFVCGPPGLIDAMRRRLAMLGVPREQVHFERFEF
jgi:predicted ferric reductase